MEGSETAPAIRTRHLKQVPLPPQGCGAVRDHDIAAKLIDNQIHVEIIKQKHMRLVIVGSITIDCRNGEIDPMSAAFMKMAGVFSELELQMIRTRVKSGMANAKAKGKRVGRPQTTKDDIPAIFYKHYPAFVSGNMNVSELARICDLSRPTVYKYLKLIA